MSGKASRAIQVAAGAFLLLLAAEGLLFRHLLPLPIYLALGVFGMLLLLYVWYTYRQGKETAGKGRLLFSGFLLLYMLGEITVNLLVAFRVVPADIPAVDLGFGVFNGPSAVYDPVRGFRWTGDTPRMAKILNKTVVYDNHFTLNNEAIYFSTDYTREKPDSNKKRYIVFGDSFTSAEYLDVPWPQRFNEFSGGDPELYSFPVNGGGLVNWHRIFFAEIAGSYEFDGIVMAVFGNDLERGFFAMHHGEETGLTGYLDTIPANTQELLEKYRDHLSPYAPYLPDSAIDRLKAEALAYSGRRFAPEPDAYLFALALTAPLAARENRRFRLFMEDNLVAPGQTYGMDEARHDLGQTKLNLFGEMVQYCRENNKEFHLVTLPYEPALPYIREGRLLKKAEACRVLADTFQLPFFDGLVLFAEIPAPETGTYFLPYDVHWSQEGSDRFAQEFYRYLVPAAGNLRE